MARLHEGGWSFRPEAPVQSDCTDPGWDLTKVVRAKTRICSHLVLWSLVVLAWVVYLTATASTQTTDVNDVHIQPRDVEKPTQPPKDNVVSSKEGSSKPGLSARVRPLKVDVDLVLVPVT